MSLPFKVTRKGEFGHRLEDLLILVRLWELLDDPRLLVGLRFRNLAEALEEVFGSLSEMFGHRHKTAATLTHGIAGPEGVFCVVSKEVPRRVPHSIRLTPRTINF